jgi:1-acyl-sn-glycerol-3-phosphate acyltransferase
LVMASPGIGAFLKKHGTIEASHANAEVALDAGAAVLVYPGGDWEVHRPSWQSGRVDFAGRTGFLKLAIRTGVPIVPVVSIGGQETLFVLTRGEALSKALGLHRFRLKVLPVSLVIPWGVTLGDFIPRLPFPAKLTTQVLPPIDLKEKFGFAAEDYTDPDLDDAYDYVTTTMQTTLDALAGERRFPVLG